MTLTLYISFIGSSCTDTSRLTHMSHIQNLEVGNTKGCVCDTRRVVWVTHTLSYSPLFRILHYMCDTNLIRFFHRSLFVSTRLYWNKRRTYRSLSIETNVAHTEWKGREYQRVSTYYTHRIGLFYRGFSHIDTSRLTHMSRWQSWEVENTKGSVQNTHQIALFHRSLFTHWHVSFDTYIIWIQLWFRGYKRVYVWHSPNMSCSSVWCSSYQHVSFDTHVTMTEIFQNIKESMYYTYQIYDVHRCVVHHINTYLSTHMSQW